MRKRIINSGELPAINPGLMAEHSPSVVKHLEQVSSQTILPNMETLPLCSLPDTFQLKQKSYREWHE